MGISNLITIEVREMLIVKGERQFKIKATYPKIPINTIQEIHGHLYGANGAYLGYIIERSNTKITVEI